MTPSKSLILGKVIYLVTQVAGSNEGTVGLLCEHVMIRKGMVGLTGM